MSVETSQKNVPPSLPAIGIPAPDFTLPAIQGEQITLTAYRGRSDVILWFSRGFTCNFCRGYMRSIIEQYHALADHQIEVIQVSPNLLDSARAYFKEPPPYPFICDPDKRLYAVYGLGDRGILEATRSAFVSFSHAFANGEATETARASWLDVVNRNFIRRLHHHALTAVEQGIFIIDKEGIIRYRKTFGPVEAIPSGEELLTITQAVCHRE